MLSSITIGTTSAIGSTSHRSGTAFTRVQWSWPWTEKPLKGHLKCHKTRKSVISFYVPTTAIKSSSPVFSSFIFPWPSQNYGSTHEVFFIFSFFPVLISFFPLCFPRLIPTKPGLMKPTSVQQRCWAAVKCREVHFLLMLSSRAAPSCFYHGIYLLGLHTCTYQPHCKCCPV